jgi:hypothetical protein
VQFLIAIDQLLNTLIWVRGDGFGDADETISARAWRLRKNSYAYKTINVLFFWQEDHCYQAYLSEIERKQLPKEYS